MSKPSVFTHKHDNPLTKMGSMGVSNDSEHLYGIYDEALENLRSTICISSELRAIENSKQILREVFEEAFEDNWNGEESKAVTMETYEVAQEFLNYLPDTIPEPEVSAEPDGEISFDWYGGNGSEVSISINETGKASFAAILGKRRYHGTDYFNCTIPERLLDHISEVVEN